MISKLVDAVVFTDQNRIQAWMAVILSAITGLVLIEMLVYGSSGSRSFAIFVALFVLNVFGAVVSFARAARERRT
jgi:uncharacterized membrane protein